MIGNTLMTHPIDINDCKFQNQLLSLLLDFCFVYKEQKFVSKVNQTNSRFCIQLIERILTNLKPP